MRRGKGGPLLLTSLRTQRGGRKQFGSNSHTVRCTLTAWRGGGRVLAVDVIADETPRHAEEEEALSHARSYSCMHKRRVAQGMTHAWPGRFEYASQEEAQGGRRPMQEATPKFSEATIGATPDAHREEAMQGHDPVCHTRGPGTHAEEEEANMGARVARSHPRGGGAAPREMHDAGDRPPTLLCLRHMRPASGS